MKIRLSFVANSSSCTFIIVNKTRTSKTFGDLVKELIEDHPERMKKHVSWHNNYVSGSNIIEPKHLIKFGKRVRIRRGINIVDIGDSEGIFGASVIGSVLEQALQEFKRGTKSFDFRVIERNH